MTDVPIVERGHLSGTNSRSRINSAARLFMRDRPKLPLADSPGALTRGFPFRLAWQSRPGARKFRFIGTETVKPIGRSNIAVRTRWVTTGRNGDDGRSLFCRFLAAAPTHRYAFHLTCSQRVH